MNLNVTLCYADLLLDQELNSLGVLHYCLINNVLRKKRIYSIAKLGQSGSIWLALQLR